MKKEIKINFGDYFLINHAVIFFNGIMRKGNLNVSELTKWFEKYENLNFKYVQEAKKLV